MVFLGEGGDEQGYAVVELGKQVSMAFLGGMGFGMVI